MHKINTLSKKYKFNVYSAPNCENAQGTNVSVSDCILPKIIQTVQFDCLERMRVYNNKYNSLDSVMVSELVSSVESFRMWKNGYLT
jgi:hypothetical protein